MQEISYVYNPGNTQDFRFSFHKAVTNRKKLKNRQTNSQLA